MNLSQWDNSWLNLSQWDISWLNHSQWDLFQWNISRMNLFINYIIDVLNFHLSPIIAFQLFYSGFEFYLIFRKMDILLQSWDTHLEILQEDLERNCIVVLMVESMALLTKLYIELETTVAILLKTDPSFILPWMFSTFEFRFSHFFSNDFSKLNYYS